MPALVLRCSLLVLILFVGCSRYDPMAGLNDAEAEAVGRITRDGNVRLWLTERDRDGHLIVWTRQGDSQARYRVIAPTAADEAAEIVVLDQHPVHRAY
jgi:hypothetical protein